MWGDVDGNIISFNYIPQSSEYHMIKPVQVNKNKKKMCGYVMLLKKTIVSAYTAMYLPTALLRQRQPYLNTSSCIRNWWSS